MASLPNNVIATAANQTTGNASLSSIDTKTLAAGQAVMASSSPVVIASNQTAIPSSQSGTWNVTNVSGTVSLPTGASTEATLSSLDAKVTAVNTGAVVVSSSALPSGASTAAKQPAIGTAGTASADVITVQGVASMTALKVDGSAVTQPVSAVSLPLPSGASTSALQTTGNTSLGNLDTNLGAVADAAVSAGATGSLAAKLRRVSTDIGTLVTKVAGAAFGTAGTPSADVISIQGVASGTVIPTVLDSYATVITSNTTTRPADTTAYAVGDLIANSTTAGSVTPFSFANATRVVAGSGEIQAVRLYKSGTSLTNANFRVHFYLATVTPSNGDNGVWLTPIANYIGSFDVTCDKAFTDGAEGAGLPTVGMVRRFQLPSGTTLYALLEARGAYTPTSGETFNIKAEISRF
jgi:hypothetical protein